MSSSLILSSNDININFFDERVNIEPSSKIIIEENIDPKNGIRCPQCYLIPQIFLQYEKAPNIECNCEIPHTKYATIIYKCENGHSQKVSLSYFLTHSKDYGIYDCICANNEDHNQNDNRDIIYRFCFICKKFFCPDCFNETHNNLNHKSCLISEFDSFCNKHYKKFKGFCQTCKVNVCEDCKSNQHLNHNINSNKIINIQSYKNKIEEAKNYYTIIRNTVIDIYKKLYEKIQIVSEGLDEFGEINKQEIELAETLVKYYEENHNKNLNYNMVQNITSLLNFNSLDLNKFNYINNINDISELVSITSSFIKNRSNCVLKNSNIEKYIANMETKSIRPVQSWAITGYKLNNNRIIISHTNGKVCVYDSDLNDIFSTVVNEKFYSFCQLLNNTLIIGTNTKYILMVFVGENQFKVLNRIDISHKLNDENQSIIMNSICLFPNKIDFAVFLQSGYVIIVKNYNGIYTVDQSSFQINNYEISNGIIVKNRLITLSRNPKKLIKFYQKEEDKCKFLKEIPDVSCSNLNNGVTEYNEKYILVPGSTLTLIDVDTCQVVNVFQATESPYICIFKMDNSNIILGSVNQIEQGRIVNNQYQKISNVKFIENRAKYRVTFLLETDNGRIIAGDESGNIFLLKSKDS